MLEQCTVGIEVIGVFLAILQLDIGESHLFSSRKRRRCWSSDGGDEANGLTFVGIGMVGGSDVGAVSVEIAASEVRAVGVVLRPRLDPCRCWRN